MKVIKTVLVRNPKSNKVLFTIREYSKTGNKMIIFSFNTIFNQFRLTF